MGLPDEDGFSVLKRIRSTHVETPVIILTARSSIDDTRSRLENGADDYMAKPFRFEELLGKGPAATASPSQWDRIHAVLRVGSLELDLGRRRARLDGP